MVGGFTITGSLNVTAFEKAIQSLVDRHQILGTVFVNVDGIPRQKIIKNLEYRLEVVDLRKLEKKAKENRVMEIFKVDGNRAFDLEQGPLFLFKLLRLEEEKYFLIANVHHLINDGWSAGVISEEVSAFYNTYLNSKENPLAPLKLQYKDYTIWHNALVDGHHLDSYGKYWIKKFSDAPNGIELPLDHPRPPVQTFNGGRIFFEINREQTARLNRLCVELEATLFMKLLALLAVFLHKYSGSEDIIIGSPIAGRNNTDLNHIIGFLVNSLVYRNTLKPAESFKDFLGGVKQETLACYENQDYPFDILVEQLGLDRDLSRSPLFNVMLAFNSMDIQAIELDLEGVTVTNHLSADVFNPGVFDLAINMDETADMIQCQLIYNSDLFDRGSMERLAANFVTLVDSVLTGPEVPIQQLKYIDEKEYEKVIETFNQTEVSFPRLTLQEMFEARVEEFPEKIAVVHNDQAMTYSHLNGEINRLAHYFLDEFLLEPGDIVGISLDRSIRMIIAILGVIKTGSGYLAIDPTYPPDRVLHMLTESNCRLVIVDKSTPCLFEGYEGKIIDIEESWPGICDKSYGNPGVVSRLTDILYVIYTSGSTGIPNGAMLTQGILANLVQWQNTRTSIDSSKRCLQFTSTGFCVSFQEIMITLVSGGELHLIGEIERQDIDYLMDFLSKHRIEILYLPFSYLNFLFNQSSRWGENFRHSLRHIITAGEQLKITAGLKDFLENNPEIKLHNHYGSSEMHVVTSYTLDAAAAAQAPIPPAGKPIANTKIYILDEYNNPVPIGVWGELFVSGSWEVAGYINNESLTEKKLLKHPFLSDGNKRLYRSGDIGRWCQDGNIHMKGRKDSQVKIRGFRVELSEIESKILAIRNVEDCVVVVKERTGGEKVLVAYVVLDHIKAAEIKKIIKNYLPLYMIPKFVVLESLPLMSNGKVDREQLPDPDAVEGYGQPVDAGKISALLEKGDFNRELHEIIGDRTALSHQEKMERMIAYFAHQVQDYSLANDKRLKVSDIDIDILGHDEKKQLLDDLQEMEAEERYIADKTLQRLFEEQARKNPDKIAVVGREQGISHSYRELNEKSNQLAHLLRQKSVGPGTAVGLMEELSVDTVIAALAILKAGAAYMATPPDLPTDKINSLLDEPPVSLLLTRSSAVKQHYFTSLQGLKKGEAKIYKTASRPSIKDFDRIPIPDRSLVDYEEYNKYIGISIVKNCMALLATRGCPYKCAYCHKIWPKQHVYRSAENIYEEVVLYYRMGVRRFVIIDDVFNLNIKNSSRFFQLVLKNKLDVQFYFASGLRGDILTKEYLDLMVEAGTADIGLSLETASPRLQKFIRKNLQLDRFRENIEYLCKKYPHVILDLNTMHGFPSETEEEALMTLDFVKSLKWIHFPYLHILKIMHNTDMERLALESGISQEAIDASVNLAFHELPDTLPFDKSFTFSCQTDFLESYFLSKERLQHVLPFQMELLTEDDIVQKYNSYLPVDITSLDDLLKFVGISRNELRVKCCAPDSSARIPNLNEKLREHFHRENPAKDALRILLLDLSQFFSGDSEAIYNVAEPPLGLMYLLTYLHQEMGDRINGKIAKSRFDFDNYDELKALLDEFKPDVIGVRTLSYYKNFLHEAIAMIRSWGIDKTIIAGGPYASSEYKTLLQDRNIDLVVMGEGEITFHELIVKIIESGGKLPDERVLKEIPGLIFIDGTQEVKAPLPKSRDILLLDGLSQSLSRQSPGNLEHIGHSTDPANIIVTAGPEGNLQTSPVSHRSVNRLIFNRNPALTLADSFVFDFSLPQWLGTLVLGGTLFIPPAKPDDPDVRLVEFYTGKMEETAGNSKAVSTHIRVVLKDKGLEGTGGYEGPGNEIEEKLVRIWSEILEIDRQNIGMNNNFFEIGGHSLKATTLIAFVHKTFNVKIKMTDIFRLPTIKEMAEFIKESTQEKYIAIEPAKEKKYYALSSAQKRVFIHHRMEIDSINYNMPSFMVMEGQLDKERFESVFKKLIRRHEILRTAFVLIDDEPMQEIHQEVEFEVRDYQVESEAETEEIINNFIRPFDLSRAPLLRIGLIKLPHTPAALLTHPRGGTDSSQEEKEDSYILMVDMHHIITDGTSIGIFVREFIALYSGKTLPGLRIQYKDFSEWQNQMYRSGELRNQEEYWTKLFAGDIPVLNMPTDYPRPSARGFEGAEYDFEMDSSMTANIKRCVLETETTLHIFLVAVFTILLSKYSGQEDIVVGFGVAGRKHADLEHVMGLFVNILPLRSHPRKMLIFSAFLEEVKKNALGAYANQDYQYEELVMKLGLQGNPGRNPLFDFLFQTQNVEVPKIQLPGLNIKPYKKVIDLTRFDLVIHVTETGDTIDVRMSYSSELYEPSTIKKMGERFKEVLDQVVKDKEIQLKDISLTQELVDVTSEVLRKEAGDFEF
jgi:amino acid adenylation domain-containing protein